MGATRTLETANFGFSRFVDAARFDDLLERFVERKIVEVVLPQELQRRVGKTNKRFGDEPSERHVDVVFAETPRRNGVGAFENGVEVRRVEEMI